MAATNFAELHPFVRAVLGDTDQQRRMFKDDVLNSHIRLLIFQQGNLDYQEVGNTAKFNVELTPLQKASAVYKVSKAIVSHMPTNFSYRTPVHAVSRGCGMTQLLAYIEEQLSEIDGGSPMAYDTDLSAILNGAWRFYSSFSEALAEPIPPIKVPT